MNVPEILVEAVLPATLDTLLVLETTNFIDEGFFSGPFGVLQIWFDADEAATATFSSRQFGEAFEISNTVSIIGDNQSFDRNQILSTLRVEMDTAGTFSAGSWSFASFSDEVRIPGMQSVNVILVGSNGSDTLRGTNFGDTLIGGRGADTLLGGLGDDILEGGSGADELYGDFYGESSIDTATYEHAPGDLDGNGVTVVMLNRELNTGEAAGDYYGSIENLTGSQFNDYLAANHEANTISGLDGDDTLLGQNGNDTLRGGNGDDSLFGQGDDDTLEGGENNDTLFGGAGRDILRGGNGIDLAAYWFAAADANGRGVTANMLDTSQNAGEAAGDSYELIENLWGSRYDDTLAGDNRDNSINGGSGDDLLIGNIGDDTLNGGEDTLFDDSGNDTLNGGLGGDVLKGGGGTDTASYANAAEGLRGRGITAHLSNASLNTGEARGDTYSSIENLTGSAFNDILGGDSGANSISGANGNDNLFGQNGHDTLAGGRNDDLLDGGRGNDTMTGGADSDTFVYRPGYNADTITDFATGLGSLDKINLRGFANLHTFADVLDRATEVRAVLDTFVRFRVDTVIDFGGGNTLTLQDVNKNALRADDFLFAPPSNDFDGNGHSDILWRNDNCALAIWDNASLFGSHLVAAAGVVPNSWHIADTGDFDGNGQSDILWRNDNGAASIWDNGAIEGAHIIVAAGVVPNSWQIAETGDFDGNGQSDILWRNDNGAAAIWDNATIEGAHIIAAAGVVPNSWHVAGTGDFDGNGRSDILWRNDNGAASIWDNGEIAGAYIIADAGVVANTWQIAGTGDFDGNGQSDILWRNDNGAVSIWDNGEIAGAHIIADAGIVPNSWQIADTGDFDANGQDDILWRNDNGAVSIWDDGQIGNAHLLVTVPNDWHIA
jgi:Ca2+-binding RTX toxin-like protein